MTEASTTSMQLWPLTISGLRVFQWNCCTLAEAWEFITEDESSTDDANITDPRWRFNYGHHFSFLYPLSRPDRLDSELVSAAIKCAEEAALELEAWDGGKVIWDKWNMKRETIIASKDIDAVHEWGEKYVHIKPELFSEYTYDPEVINVAIRAHADSYMQQVLSHLTSI
jgi:hypothetical protein